MPLTSGMNVARWIAQRLNKPHFLFRPGQLARRISWSIAPPTGSHLTVTLPWGLTIRCRPTDGIGGSIARTGVFELVVTEALFRLAEPGELAIDAGANIGYMSGVLAVRVAPGGRVLAFEPHPEVFEELQTNISRWASNPAVAPIEARRIALSDAPGRGELVVGEEFATNSGVASLAAGAAQADAAVMRWPVELTTLDEAVGAAARVGVMKVDVEGHEASLLRGAARLLSEGRIRDIVFEANDGYPSPVSDTLEAFGYRIYALVPTLLRPRALAPAAGAHEWPPWETSNCLATFDSDRALARLRPWGWRALGA